MVKLLTLLGFIGMVTFLTYASLLLQVERVEYLPPRVEEVEIMLTGDVMLGRTVMTKSLDLNDTAYPFRLVGDELRKADITLINLENPIIENCPRRYDGFIFCASPEMVEGLSHAGVDIVNLANNHTLNYGAVGLKETQEILDRNTISFTGVGEVVVKEVHGTRFGFLGFDKSQQEAPEFTETETELIIHANQQVDVLIVSMHWGFEYQSQAHESQEQLAKKLVELGADVIVGHHPHWIQNIEYIHEVPVYYSLGNFVFDQMFEKEVREGMAIRLIFNNTEIMKEERLFIFMENWAQPRWQSSS